MLHHIANKQLGLKTQPSEISDPALDNINQVTAMVKVLC